MTTPDAEHECSTDLVDSFVLGYFGLRHRSGRSARRLPDRAAAERPACPTVSAVCGEPTTESVDALRSLRIKHGRVQLQHPVDHPSPRTHGARQPPRSAANSARSASTAACVSASSNEATSPARALIVGTRLQAQGSLSDRRQHPLRGQHLGDAMGESQPSQPGLGQHDRVVASFIQMPQPRVHVAADVEHLQIRPDMQQLGPPTHAPRAHPRTRAQRLELRRLDSTPAHHQVARAAARRPTPIRRSVPWAGLSGCARPDRCGRPTEPAGSPW